MVCSDLYSSIVLPSILREVAVQASSTISSGLRSTELNYVQSSMRSSQIGHCTDFLQAEMFYILDEPCNDCS